MKRDVDLLREILFRLEERPREFSPSSALLDLAPKAKLFAHLRLLEDSGLLIDKSLSPVISEDGVQMGWRITSAGHDFLDSVRDPEIWRKTKAGAGQLGSWTVKVLADLATGYLRVKAQELGLPLQ